MSRALLAALSAAPIVALAAPAAAQGGRTMVTARRVEVGQPFVVKFSVVGSPVTSPNLTLPPGMQSSSVSTEMQTYFDMNSGQRSVGVNLIWQVTPTRPGKFKVGPPSALVGGARVQGDVQQVEVVPQGANGGQNQMNPFDPFGMMGQLGGGFFPPGFFQDFQQQQPPPEEQLPDDMRVEQASDPIAFVRATIAPRRAVVGEQVTLHIYSYASRGRYGFASATEPVHGDFLSYNIENSDGGRLYPTTIGGARFLAANPRNLALFPLHAGTLRSGGMKLGFSGDGYATKNPAQGLERVSNFVEVSVSEPPLQGRPPGYKIGDVGDYTLSAQVDPKQVVAGDAVSVVATLSGVGNVPFKLITPENPGAEWLEPTVSEHVDAKNGIVQGSRTFTYVVRLSQAGAVDLGELTLPYFDPKRHAYQTARAPLGVVSVKPNPKLQAASKEQAPDHLASLLTLRKALGPDPGVSGTHLGDRHGFWWLVFGAPLAVVLSGGGLSAFARVRERLRARGESPLARIEQALAEAERSAARDPAATVAALERAVFGAIELKLGLKARAVLKSELERTLRERGLPEPLARETSALLEDCDTLRFVGEASGVQAEQLVPRARKLVSDLRAGKLAAQA